MYKQVRPTISSHYSISLQDTTSQKSCDTDELDEYNWMLNDEVALSSKFIVDDHKQKSQIIAHSKKLDKQLLFNVPFIREYYQKLYYCEDELNRESYGCVFEDVFGYSLFEESEIRSDNAGESPCLSEYTDTDSEYECDYDVLNESEYSDYDDCEMETEN